MKILGELFTDFSRIDLDARGGYSRVAEVKAVNPSDGHLPQRAFKLMRHEIDHQRTLARFLEEFRLLLDICQDANPPKPVTRIYDSGFAPLELSQTLHRNEPPDPKLKLIPTGLDISLFQKTGQELQQKEPERWLPYLVMELAPYDDSLLRQIHHQPQDDFSGLYRLPTGEVIAMALQLLDVMDYLHKRHKRAYMDWKPEHLFWSGEKRQVKLIDWNVNTPLDDGPGERQNIRDDIRIFCGAALYISLTFIDPDEPSNTIGPRPTRELGTPVPEIRKRYWTDRPDFHQRGRMLDDNIKKIIQKGLDPNQGFDTPQELRQTLLEYAQQELGMTAAELKPGARPESEYFKALEAMRGAQAQLLQAQQNLIDAIGKHGETLEYNRLFETIKRALKNFPIS